ncbi:GTPase ObgE [Candidatus Saccharibacteria bacterium]|nr:GTPase ObgE [Candidatus Saccharibacteria bacterium]
MFVDTATVFIQAGKGGNGAVSFRHEIYVDKGGPDGGDGGKGGDVIFQASKNVNTLLDFRYKPELKAKPGANGAKRNRAGRSGEPLIVKVPMGTIVKRGGHVVADLTDDNQEATIARGGDGGFGNAHFKSSTRQTPRIAELGEDGDTFEAELELKLLADVGLVGFPNAGKSTLLSVVSNARPEIADYPFTTLTPNLGVADIDDTSLLIADIPGLIEGASVGKGLGDAFLRHIERTAVLLHLIDAYSNDIAKDYTTIRQELARYSQALVDRPEVIVLTKIEGLDSELIDMQINALKTVAPNSDILAISALAHKGLKETLRVLVQHVAKAHAATAENDSQADATEDVPRITLSSEAKDLSWQVQKQADSTVVVYVVSGAKIEKFARRTNFSGYENVNRLRDIMKKMGITHELTRQGAQGDSVVRIGASEFTLIEQ